MPAAAPLRLVPMMALVTRLEPRQHAPQYPADPLWAVPGRILSSDEFALRSTRASLDRIALESTAIAGNARRLLSMAIAVLRHRVSLHPNHIGVQRCAMTQTKGGENFMARPGENP